MLPKKFRFIIPRRTDTDVYMAIHTDELKYGSPIEIGSEGYQVYWGTGMDKHVVGYTLKDAIMAVNDGIWEIIETIEQGE